MQSSKLFRTVLILLLFIAVVFILVKAKPFLVPLAFAGLLSLFLMPVTRWLERKGAHKVLASMGAVLTFIAALGIILGLLGWQLSGIAKDSQQIEQQLKQKIAEVQTFAAETLHIPQEKQKEMLEKQKQSGAGASSMVSTFLGGLGGMLTNFLLVLIYLFLFVHYRRHFVDFLLKLVPAQRRNETREVVGNAQEAIQKYFTGMAFMIICLWVMYGIGFSIIGVKNPIFFAMLCGTLEIVPFVGNLAGTAITMLMAIGQGGSMNMIIWIVVVYAIVQFIQSYILEPLVVGKEVKVNPFFTIAGIVAGEVIWGIPGMIMALPTMAIFKIVCDHVESLHPYGFLIGNEEAEKKTKRRRA